MKKDDKKRSVAPDDVGELPNEHRCPQCFGLLSQTVTNGKVILWCIRCGIHQRTG